ncbi:MAG: hypothetical protein EXS58_10575 [Candidatus Latescibacteria bacterium]|nr:hypothetical protein [Candidatus Latescibacterota bacterium]
MSNTDSLWCARRLPPKVAGEALVALEAGEASSPAVAACTSDRLLDAIGELFGPVYPFGRRRRGQDLPRPYQPDQDWPTPVAHVDGSYPTIMPNGWAVGSFVFLTKVLSRGGAFICFPGSPNRYRQAMARACHLIKGAAPQPQYAGPYCGFLAEPGDALLFHHLFGHTGSTNVANPITRHALLARWHPHERIVPGDKPFSSLSTIEKANSARYLAHHYGLDLQVVTTPNTPTHCRALGEGFACWGDLVSYTLLHFDGQAQLFYVDRSYPDTVQRLVSDDLLVWRPAAPFEPGLGPIRSLQIHQYTLEAVLGISAGVPAGAHLYHSLDLDHWAPVAQVEGVETATPWYVYARYPSKVAAGQALYVVPTAEQSTVVCQWGYEWAAAGGWATHSVAAQAPAGGVVRDLTVAAYFADSHAAIVADVTLPRAPATMLCYALPKDIALAEGPLEPLSCDTPSPPRLLRVFSRGRHYWRVSYVRQHQGQERLFWGYVDWAQSPVVLRELSSMAAFERARQIAGFV